jgi:hypothetical protein
MSNRNRSSGPIFLTTDYKTVIAELRRRGLPIESPDPGMPNVTLANFPEIFYIQKNPPLASWAKFAMEWEFQAVLNQATIQRLEANSKWSLGEVIGKPPPDKIPDGSIRHGGGRQ